MKKYIALAVLLLFVSSCSILSYDPFTLDKKAAVAEPKDTVANGQSKVADYGPVTTADKEMYTQFQIRVACGESSDKLLQEYKIDINRLVEIGRTVDGEILKSSVFEGVMSRCPDKIESVEPSIGKSE